MKIYLIRHGESTGDVENLYGGSYDDHLSKHGEGQARVLAEKLKGLGIETLYVSPYLRARETADIVRGVFEGKINIVPDFRERSYGVLSGMNKDYAREKFPEAVALHKDYRNTDPEGESYEDFKNRVLGAFEKIVRDVNNDVVGILTHGGPIKCLYREILSPGHEAKDIGDCGVLEVIMEKGESIIVQKII